VNLVALRVPKGFLYNSLITIDLGRLDAEQPECMCIVLAHLGNVVPRAKQDLWEQFSTPSPAPELVPARKQGFRSRKLSSKRMARSPFIRLCGAKLHANSDKWHEGTSGGIRKHMRPLRE